jgi:hypothetical protein
MRKARVRTDLGDRAPTVERRHLRVEDDDDREPVQVASEQLESGPPVAGLEDLETGQLEVDPHEQTD